MRFKARLALLVLLSVGLGFPQGRAEDAKRALLKRYEPAYPELARQMRLGGSVLLQILIEADGHVSKVKTVSGHPLLAGAAEIAVRTWKYAPAGQSTEGMVKVDFILH